jgi:hypothetical protein
LESSSDRKPKQQRGMADSPSRQTDPSDQQGPAASKNKFKNKSARGSGSSSSSSAGQDGGSSGGSSDFVVIKKATAAAGSVGEYIPTSQEQQVGVQAGRAKQKKRITSPN